MDQIALIKLVVSLTIVVGLIVLERRYPLAQRIGGMGRIFSNFSLAGGNAILSPVLIVPITALATQIGPAWRGDAWTGGAWILLDLILLDFAIYWWHRASHEIPFLWRFHEVHHLDRFLDVSSAVRFHFGEVILSALARGVVVIVLDIPLISVLIFDSMVLLGAAFQHSNVKLPKGVDARLRRVVVTPDHHWVHHHRVRADTDSNYGTVFTLWDRLFGSFSRTIRTPDMPIGTEGREERSLQGLVVRPLEKP